jgi:hypothetical protein
MQITTPTNQHQRLSSQAGSDCFGVYPQRLFQHRTFADSRLLVSAIAAHEIEVKKRADERWGLFDRAYELTSGARAAPTPNSE